METSALTKRIRTANEAGRKAMILYLPAGFPDRERFWEVLKDLDQHGADILEIGVPFSDPVADGPVIEQASQECLERGVSLAWILEELRRRRSEFQSEIVLMGYMNPFLQYGLQRVARDAAQAGAAGCIVPDLPLEEAGEMRRVLSRQGLDLVPLIGLNTPRDRLASYASVCAGFAYMVSVLGTTGAREVLPAEVVTKLREVREFISHPLALGFGIKKPEQVARFKDSIDAVVIGSALVSHLRSGGDAAAFLAPWR